MHDDSAKFSHKILFYDDSIIALQWFEQMHDLVVLLFIHLSIYVVCVSGGEFMSVFPVIVKQALVEG